MKELEELKDLKNAFVGHCKELDCDENYIKVCENKFSKIEKELKRLEELENRCTNVGITIDEYFKYLIVDQTIDNYKKLEVFETIKEKLVVGYDESENDGSCLTLGVRGYNGVLLVFYTTFDKEKVDLFKEVLL